MKNNFYFIQLWVFRIDRCEVIQYTLMFLKCIYVFFYQVNIFNIIYCYSKSTGILPFTIVDANEFRLLLMPTNNSTGSNTLTTSHALDSRLLPPIPAETTPK